MVSIIVVVVQVLIHVRLCNLMDCSTPGFPVLQQLPELTQTCPSSQWCHPTTSSFVIPFSSCLQSFPSSGSFPMSQFFTPGGQIFGASASTSVFPMNIQDWFPLGLMGLISFSPRDSQESSPAPQFKSISSSVLSFLYSPTLTSIYDSWKTIALTRWTFVGKVMSLLFNMLSRLIIALILRNYSKEARWVACIYEFGYGIHALKHISQ